MRYLLFLSLTFLALGIYAQPKIYDLNPVTVTNEHKVDTVFGTRKFSVADYEFMKDRLVLLTYTKNMKHASLVLTDNRQTVISTYPLPDEAKELYKDYQGYINVICEEHIYRIRVEEDHISLSSLPVDEYKHFIMPCLDTIQSRLFFSNYQKEYPEFTYYAYNSADSSLDKLHTVCDQETMKGYNMEYYFLKPKERVQAWKYAEEYKVDVHRIAAAMSGLTSSMYYTPLYAPFFSVDDSIYIFDHYSNAIFLYSKDLKLLDSVPIDYHHPKSWREWKQMILFDKEQKKAYAVYQKAGFYYLKQIDLKTGKIVSSFKLTNQYVDKLKVKNGYIYYVYSPFESLQEYFVYKELIRN